ncbi:radical SAM protein [Candidatus Woesearchaeota archaeon]|nr:radical SAM protein [Candidatus Woesearchaeota archaeon]
MVKNTILDATINPLAKGILKLSLKLPDNQRNKLWEKTLDWIDRKIYHSIIIENYNQKPLVNRFYQYKMGSNLLGSVKKRIKEDKFSKEALDGMINVFLSSIFFRSRGAKEFERKNRYKPPKFMTISPLGGCNLQCVGCYANAISGNPELEKENTIDYNTLDEIVSRGEEELGMAFFVISGGEPTYYKSQGKEIYDLFRNHPNSYFLMYTNGTLLAKEENADKLASLGNATPAFSVEGFKEETEARRGKNVYKSIIKGMDNIRERKIPFGISFTATRQNVNILSDPDKRKRFVDFYFNEKEADYLWAFHYMPIGKDVDFNLTLTPKQRTHLIDDVQHLIFKYNIFAADFWNAAVTSDGCISGGRGMGYDFVDYDGTPYPCVFNPYYDKEYSDIREIFKRGESLVDILNSPLYVGIRKWIDEYSYNQPPEKSGNLWMPCMIRDHYKELMKIIDKVNENYKGEGPRVTVRPKNGALLEESYCPNICRIAEETEKLTGPLWKKYQNTELVVKRFLEYMPERMKEDYDNGLITQ